MEFVRERQTAKELVEAWRAGSLTRNPEYQRGQAWKTPQKQALIDSLFRKYPIPPIFLERKSAAGLFGSKAEQFEIIDGQQRILSLSGFFSEEFELLKPSEEKLRLPHSLREKHTPWSGRRYGQLDSTLKEQIDSTEIDVYLVENVANPDEVRDLFIRLQSGTPLTRQQIRDAWPGQIGPLVEAYAGKLTRRPKYRVFAAIDGRAMRDDEGDPNDPYVKHRQTCAQLLRILIARMYDPKHFPSVQADDIDSFYHDQTNIDPNGPMVQELERILDLTQTVTDVAKEKWYGKKKPPKLSVFALALFFQDMEKSPLFKFDSTSAGTMANFVRGVEIQATGRTVSGPAIRSYYEAWLCKLPEGIGIRLDEKRSFSDDDRKQIRKRAEGNCQVCGDQVDETEAEYDHHPLPYFLGGRTTVENGRLVHKNCHPRGHPDVLKALHESMNVQPLVSE